MLDTFTDPLTIVLSVVALIVTAVFSWTNQIDRRAAARLNREKDLHAWVMRMAEIYMTLRSGTPEERDRALAQLSVMIDYGRLIFPNEYSVGAPKEYPKGRRSAVLDPLVETHERCLRNGYDENMIAADWREFTDQLTARTTAFAINTSPEAEGRAQYRNR